MEKAAVLSTITVNDDFVTVFAEETFPQHTRGGMVLTDRIEAQNLRLRESAPGYQTDWHVAGDPTLIIIQQGTLRIHLQNGDYRDFSKGDSFIARDYLPDNIDFDKGIHGHKAEVRGNDTLKAVHIKLVKQTD
ncbi:MAG: hypothetical protein HEP71_03120 [Roseivirga sp.]|nr:hypothetical protein [Roseivirga sp.]